MTLGLIWLAAKEFAGSIPWRVWAVLAAAAAFAGALFFFHHAAYVAGGTAAKAEIETQDREAVDVADETRAAVRACFDAGRMWDTSTGNCGRPRQGVSGAH